MELAFRQNDEKFVAAEAHGEIRGANDLRQAIGKSAQDEITGGVAKFVVDGLEGIQIEHENAQGMAVALGAGDFGFEAFAAQAAVREPGERVARGQAMKFLGANFEAGEHFQMLSGLAAKTLDEPLLVNRVKIEEQDQSHEGVNRDIEIKLEDLVGLAKDAGERNHDDEERQEQHYRDGGPPQPPVATLEPLQVFLYVFYFPKL